MIAGLRPDEGPRPAPLGGIAAVSPGAVFKHAKT